MPSNPESRFATNEGVRIHYQLDGQVEGNPDGPAIIMHHGFLADLTSWRDRGFVQMLGDRFKIILMDSRGHGLSDKPREVEAYDFRTRVMDVVTVLNECNVRQAHYLGYSMGGMVGYTALIYAPQRFLSFTLGGSQPLSDAPQRAVARSGIPFRDYYRDAIERNPAAKAASDAGLHDIEALSACRDSLIAWKGAEQAVRLAQQPILAYVGTDDTPHQGALKARSLNPNLKVIELEGDNHFAAATRSNIVVPCMLEMLEGVTAK